MNLLSKTRTTISTHALFERGDTVVVGVSGGPDSLALLHALRMLAPELGIALHVAHLNHQLRGADAEADAEFVAWLAREWNLPVTVEARDVAALAREKRLSLEEAGRNARQEFFARVAGEQHARVVAVGHHADDQVETVLMHFIRGAGLAGLRGMPYRSAIQDFILVRPFLDITRAEIETYCAENHLHPRRDVSNEDLTFYRNRLRHEVIPYLETLNPNLRAVVHRAAQTIADDYAYLHAQVESAYARVAREADGVIVFAREAYRALEPSLQRAILRVAILRLRAGLRNIAWQHIEDARRVALDKDAGAEATLPQGLQLVVGYGDFMIGESYPAPDIPLIHAPLVLRVPGVTELDAEWEVVEQGSRRAEESRGARCWKQIRFAGRFVCAGGLGVIGFSRAGWRDTRSPCTSL
jgi:tRNA(Ile)-lysidine synthase